jgi:hypothetical protein
MLFATSVASACRVWLKSFSREGGARRRAMKETADGGEPNGAISIAA